MTSTRTTYRRADGQSFQVTTFFRSEIDGILAHYIIDPRDVIEEQWQLVRHRVVRLGADEPCDNCGGKGTEWFPNESYDPPCPICNSTGVKPRDPNPPWTTTEKET